MTDFGRWRLVIIAVALAFMTLGAWIAGNPMSNPETEVSSGPTPGLDGSVPTTARASSRSSTTTGSTATPGSSDPSTSDPVATTVAPGSPTTDPYVPFTMAEAVTSPGATTIPRPSRTVATTTTTTPPPAPPTTLPAVPILKPPGAIGSICGMSEAIGSFSSIVFHPEYATPEVVAKMRDNLGQYQSSAPPGVSAQVNIIVSNVLQLLAAIEATGFDVNGPAAQQILADFAVRAQGSELRDASEAERQAELVLCRNDGG